MGIQIHELATKSGNLSSSDYLVVDNGSVTAKIDYTKLAKAILDVYSDSNLNTSEKTVVGAINQLYGEGYMLQSGTRLEQNTNLNTIVAPGNYYNGSSSTVATMSNVPEARAFTMKVEDSIGDYETATSIYRRQIFRPFDSERVYERRATGSLSNPTWSDWVVLPTRDEMTSLYANYGCKNLFYTAKRNAQENGITFTVNSDASITVSGTATANAYLTVYNWAALSTTTLASAKGKAVRLSGGTANVRFTVAYRASSSASSTEAKDTGSGASITLPSNESYQIYVALRVTNGVTVNETIYPMICLASIPDDTYVPYAPTNAELYDMIKSLQ